MDIEQQISRAHADLARAQSIPDILLRESMTENIERVIEELRHPDAINLDACAIQQANERLGTGLCYRISREGSQIPVDYGSGSAPIDYHLMVCALCALNGAPAEHTVTGRRGGPPHTCPVSNVRTGWFKTS